MRTRRIKSYGAVISRMGTGEVPLMPTPAGAELPHPAMLSTVTFMLPSGFTTLMKS